MKILLACKHPPNGRQPIGGVQTWINTVSAELQKRGYGVSVWGPEFSLPKEVFDLGILANLRDTWIVKNQCVKFTEVSHGVILDEQISEGGIATSEEVRDTWGAARVIRQPIDLEFWSPADHPKTYLVRHSYRGGLTFLPDVAESMGLEYIHLKNEPPERVRHYLQRAAVVVASGRALLEAMACGAPSILADDREYQGPLLHTDLGQAMQMNYSGRGGVEANEANVRDAIDRVALFSGSRRHVEKYHDVRNIVDQLMGSLQQ